MNNSTERFKEKQKTSLPPSPTHPTLYSLNSPSSGLFPYFNVNNMHILLYWFINLTSVESL